MIAVLWPEKDPAEKLWLTFDYSEALATAETISLVSIEVTLKAGEDATPASFISGSPAIMPDGTVMQFALGGVDMATYLVKCTATTSSGRVLVLGGKVPVRAIA